MKRILILILLILLTFTGCSKPNLLQDRAQSITVITGEPTLADLPHYLALKQGFFETEDLNVKTKTIADQNEALAQLAKADHQVLLTTGDVLLTKAEVTCIAGVTRQDGTFLVARAAEDGLDWPSLKSKSILAWPAASLRGINQEYLVQQLGFKAQTDLTLVQNVPTLDLAGAYAGGISNFAVLAEPEVSQLQRQGQALPINTTATLVNNYPYSGYYAPTATLKQDAKALQSLTNGLYRAQLWVKTHKPAAVATAVSQYYPDIDKEVLKAAIARYQTNQFWSYTPAITPTAVSTLATMFHQTERLPATNDLTGHFINDFATNAVRTVPPPQPPAKKGKK